MNNFDIKSAKYVSIVILICFIFVMVVWHAFRYLPSETPEGVNLPPAEEQQIDNNETASSAEEEAPQPEETRQERSEDWTPKVSTEPDITTETISGNDREVTPTEPLEAIDEDEKPEVDSLTSALNNAQRYKDNKQYVKAISEYQKAISLTTDIKTKANCYEEISSIYAIAKRYGTALSFAQKAYNMVPTTAREILLARLYYKTGDADKATTRMNNVLRRDFTADN